MAKFLESKKKHKGGIIGDNRHKLADNLFSIFDKELKPDEIMTKLRLNEVVLEPTIAMPKLQKNIASLLASGKNGDVTNYNYNLRMNIEKLSGTKEDANMVFKTLVGGLQKRGIKI